MLQRIISIKNVGRFKNCAAAGDVTFRRFTLIFAENARGKTTLCAILRSLLTNDPALVSGRATLGSTEHPEIQLLTVAGPITFRNGVWSEPFPDIAVFDGTYVSENVYAGDAVDTEHRRNLYRVIIGAQGVTLAARITELDEQIRAKNAQIRDNRTQMQRHIPQGMNVDTFVALAQDPEIDSKIAAKEQELQAARQAVQLQKRTDLSSVPVPVFPASFAQLLAKTVETVAAEAELRVREHLTRHGMQARGEIWLTEGLQYVREDSCPFCSQDLAGVGLIQGYRSFFSREYHALREEVTGLQRQVESAVGDRVAATIEQTILQNTASVEFWRQYCDVSATVPPEMAKIDEKMGALRHAAQLLLDVKRRMPLERVAPDERYTHALAAFEALRASVGTYNVAVATANATIAARKRQAQAANVREVEGSLARLSTQKIRHTVEVHALCDRDGILQGEKERMEINKAAVRQLLDAHTQQVIAQYGERINWYLERINAGFRITTPTHTYRGGAPSTSYQIIINRSAIDLGDPETPVDRPSFKNTLSAGDRNTLALAVFLAQLEQDPGRARKVVVFDDPFTSMDSFRRNHTVHQICRCGEICAQVVILSHETGFLHLLWQRIAPMDRKSLWMARVGEENTTIVEWDIEQALRDRYRADLDTLQRFFSVGEGNGRDVIQKIRPVLEAYCRKLYPTQFGEQEMLGGIIRIIRNAGIAHPLSAIVEDLEELNMYCRRYHHGENPNAATEAVDDAELQGYVRRTLKLVGYFS